MKTRSSTNSSSLSSKSNKKTANMPSQKLSSSNNENKAKTTKSTKKAKEKQAGDDPLPPTTPDATNTSTWANDEEEEEKSPSYQKQLQVERNLQKQSAQQSIAPQSSDTQNSPSLLQQAQSKISSILQPFPLTSISALDKHRASLQPQAQTEAEELSLSSLKSISDATVIKVPKTPIKTNSKQMNPITPAKEEEKNDYYHDENVAGWGPNDDWSSEDDSDENNSKDPTLTQDDVNTIGSGKTSVIRKKDMGKVVIPPYVRFQMMIPPEIEDEEGDGADTNYRDNYDRIKEILTTLVTQLRILDEKVEVISWRSKQDFSFLPKGSFPDDVATIAKFFKGFKKRMRADRRVYIKFGVHTPNDFNRVEEDLQSWAELYSYTIKRCLIQSNDAGYVGWICYTSQFTDTQQWRDYLMGQTSYEWGFKLVPITNADKHIHWNKRLKAMGIYVPIDNVDEAKYEISELLLHNEEMAPNSNVYQDRFVFVPPEETLGEEPETLIAYQSFVLRHQAHTEALCAKASTHIKVPLSRTLRSRIYPTLCLQEMILSIMVKEKSNPLFGTPLFHSVDFVSDISKLWMQNKPEEGGPAVIFTYYKPVQKEASQMVTGLGRYIARTYGRDAAISAFHSNHWKATRGWKYSHSTGTFSRPDTKNLITTMAFDNNLSTIRRLQSIALQSAEQSPPSANNTEEESKTEAAPNGQNTAEPPSNRYTDVDGLLETKELQSDQKSVNTSSTTSGLTAAVLQQENEIVNRIKEEQLSAQQKLIYKNNPVRKVDMDTDSRSDVSSLSKASFESNEEDSVSIGSLQSMGDSIASGPPAPKTKSNKFSFNFDVLNKIIDPKMSYEEVKSTAEAYFSHRQNREVSHKDQVLYSFLASKFPKEAAENAAASLAIQSPLEHIKQGDDEYSLESLETSLTQSIVHRSSTNDLGDLLLPPPAPDPEIQSMEGDDNKATAITSGDISKESIQQNQDGDFNDDEKNIVPTSSQNAGSHP